MSEIIASVYDMIEETGKKEGILFLDEINCVSETLAPAILQFLQYKIFGRHRVPDGWIVVTAGNPPEYNNSVREFDIVTWDRLKRIDVEADYSVWKEYAINHGVHPAITTYLDVKKDHFYKIETTVDGKSFVTARGWLDLSDMIKLYEKNNIIVDEKLVGQYLQNCKIAKDFAVYYDLFNKYKSDYQVEKILLGEEDESIKERAKNAKFDERLTLLGILVDAVVAEMSAVYYQTKAQTELLSVFRTIKAELTDPEVNVADLLMKRIEEKENAIENGRKTSSLGRDELNVYREVIAVLNKDVETIKKEGGDTANDAFALIKRDFDHRTKKMNEVARITKNKLSNMFAFCKESFGSQEMLILVTEITISRYGSFFVGHYGCEEYFAHNKELLFYERQKEIIREIDLLEL